MFKGNKFRYIRFVVPQVNPESKTLLGFLHGAAALIEEGKQPEYIIQSIEDEISWFNRNLNEPDCYKQNMGINNIERGVCWFKPTAIEHLQHGWNLVALLDDAGIAIRFVTSEDPGAIIWEDEYQVVAKPWRRHKDGFVRT